MESVTHSAAGERVYNRLPQADKDELTSVLSSSLVDTHQSGSLRRGSTGSQREEWSLVVEGIVRDVIRRRAASGLPIDAHAVVEEVMPLAVGVVPQALRKDLYTRMHDMLFPATH